MASPAPLAATFRIAELTGDQRVIILQDRGKPYRGLGFKGKQRANVTWLPGAGVGTSTVLGPTEEPTSVHGMWKDKYFGAMTVDSSAPPCMLLNNQAILSVKDAVAFTDSFRRLGQLVRVTWAHIIRVGFLTEFEHTWDNEHDVTWNMEFTWVSQGDDPGPVVPAGGPQLADLSSTIRQQMDAFDNTFLPKNFGLSNGFLNGIQNFQHNLEDLVFKIEDTVVLLTDQVLAPVRAARGIMTTLRGIQGECEDLIGFVTGQVSGELNGGTAVQDQSFSERLEAEAFSRDLQAWAQELRRQSIEQRANLAARVNYDLIAIHTVRANEDLRTISRLYYGSPFEWRRIMIYNDLSSMVVSQGDVLLIPSISQISESDVRPGS